jgi:hypothetical protein
MTTTMIRTDIDIEPMVPARAVAGGRQRWTRRNLAGLALAGGLAVLGSQMTANANYSARYVTEQLGALLSLAGLVRSRRAAVEPGGR